MNTIQRLVVKGLQEQGSTIPDRVQPLPANLVEEAVNTLQVSLDAYKEDLRSGDLSRQLNGLLDVVRWLYEHSSLMGVDLETIFKVMWEGDQTFDLNAEKPLLEDGNLVRHARRELSIIGEDEQTIEGVARVMEAWGDMGHSGGSHFALAPILSRLLNFEPLTPLTNDPQEWYFHADGTYGIDGTHEEGGFWQNIRNGAAFSNDHGQTYWLTSEGANDGNRFPLHKSVDANPENAGG